MPRRPKPEPDAPRFALGEFVRRRVKASSVGQVVAVVFLPGAVSYRVQFAEGQDEFYELELEAAEEPHQWAEGAGAEGE